MSRHPHLEDQLTELSGSVDWPDADVAARVWNRITTRSHEPRKVRIGWKAAIATVCVLAAITVVPAGRQAVADLLSVAGIDITFSQSETPADPGPVHLGEPTTLESAARQVEFPLALPTLTDLENPDAVYVETGPPVVVHLTWEAGPSLPAIAETNIGLLLTQFASPAEGTILTKELTSDTDIVETSVNGQEALWLQGAPHELTYNRTATQQVSRLAANVLLWEDNGVTYRLESALEMNAAQQIAETLATHHP
ncbi:MAG: hypothetical protein ACLFWH_11085 [Actinomycetota bacterium]